MGRRTLETTCEIQQSTSSSIAAQPKSKSLSDLFGLLPVSLLRSRKSADIPIKRPQIPPDIARSSSSFSGIYSSNDDIHFPDCVRHKAIQTESLESLEEPPVVAKGPHIRTFHGEPFGGSLNGSGHSLSSIHLQ